jgi:hypothetical protein
MFDLPIRFVVDGVDICICTGRYKAGGVTWGEGKPLRGQDSLECVIRDWG